MGSTDGAIVGALVGTTDGATVGVSEGTTVGATLGCEVGAREGVPEGHSVGALVGCWMSGGRSIMISPLFPMEVGAAVRGRFLSSIGVSVNL